MQLVACVGLSKSPKTSSTLILSFLYGASIRLLLSTHQKKYNWVALFLHHSTLYCQCQRCTFLSKNKWHYLPFNPDLALRWPLLKSSFSGDSLHYVCVCMGSQSDYLCGLNFGSMCQWLSFLWDFLNLPFPPQVHQSWCSYADSSLLSPSSHLWQNKGNVSFIIAHTREGGLELIALHCNTGSHKNGSPRHTPKEQPGTWVKKCKSCRTWRENCCSP